jgi:formylglycine-generating enzyme required for sulfatase activity
MGNIKTYIGACFLGCLTWSCQAEAFTTTSSQKEALLIANGNYTHLPHLSNPSTDSKTLAQTLQNLGFRVTLLSDASREDMLDAIQGFEDRVRASHGLAFFHYGGHGVQVDGSNYLIPVNADITDDRKLKTRAVDLEEIMSSLDAAGAEANIIVLDACRNNPLPRGTRSLSRGLAVVQTKPKNSIIVYAADAGHEARDGVFTPTLAKELMIPGKSFHQVLLDVRKQVAAQTGNEQTPAEYSELTEDITLNLGENSLQGVIETLSPNLKNSEPERQVEPVVMESLTSQQIHAALSTSKEETSGETTPIHTTLSFDKINDQVLVESGQLPPSSPMGAIFVRSFLIDRYPITWKDWKIVRDWASIHGYDIGTVGQGSGDNHPVRNVSWYDVIKWCNARSEKESLNPVYYSNGDIYRTGDKIPNFDKNANGFRLPTEVEWEWAARGGVRSRGYKYSGSDNIDEVAWYWDNSMGSEVDIYQGRGTWPVGLKKPNELGLYDMSGNIWEWCWDTVHGSYRALRGGRWSFPAERCAITYRANYGVPTGHADHYGFRTVHTN